MNDMVATIRRLMEDALHRAVGGRLTADDRTRIEFVLTIATRPRLGSERISAALRRVPARDTSLTQLGMFLGLLPSELRKAAEAPSVARSAAWRVLSAALSVDESHRYYRTTWWGALRDHHDARINTMRAIVPVLDQLGIATGEHLSVLVGAPLSTIPTLEQLIAQIVRLPHPGELTDSVESRIKHRLNELVLDVWLKGSGGNLFEACQGGGDGTRSYQQFGCVVSSEINGETLNNALCRVAHIHLDLASTFPPADSPLSFMMRQGYSTPPWPALLPGLPVSAAHLTGRLAAWKWTFDWLDVDAYGIMETSGIEFEHIVRVAASPSIMVLSNGLSWQRRFALDPTIENRAIAVLTGGIPAYSDTQRRRQRQMLFDHIAAVEAAFRIRQALAGGYELHPLLLYDGRTQNGGIHRTYYLLRRGVQTENRAILEHMVPYRTDLLLRSLPTEALEPWAGRIISPSKVLTIRFEDIAERDELNAEFSKSVRAFLSAKIAMLVS